MRRLRALRLAAVVAVGVASSATAACGSTATSSRHPGPATPCPSGQGVNHCATSNSPTAPTPTVSANAAAVLFLSVNVPEPPANSGTYFYGITCVSTTECWAVGTTENTTQALIEHFDGTSWKIAVQDPNAFYFYGIACVAADNCWAAGTGSENRRPPSTPGRDAPHRSGMDTGCNSAGERRRLLKPDLPIPQRVLGRWESGKRVRAAVAFGALHEWSMDDYGDAILVGKFHTGGCRLPKHCRLLGGREPGHSRSRTY